MKTAWHFQVDFTTQLIINAKLIYMMLAIWNPDDMCYEAREPIFIYTAKMLDLSTGLSVGALLKSKQSDLIIRHPPFWDYIPQWFTTQFVGDVCGSTLRSRSVDSLGQQFLDLLDQASRCHAGMAGSSWLHMCGMGCHRLWCLGILLNSWHGRNSWSLFHLSCWCCRCSRCGLHAWCRCRWCRVCC